MANLIQELKKRFTQQGDCWIWHGRIDTTGYGRYNIKGDKDHGAHRLVYETLLGVKVPKEFHLDHLCRTPLCVNPDHLEPVTCRENVLRGIGPAAINAKKTGCHNGHEYTTDNLYIDPRGKRECRICRKSAMSAYLTRKAVPLGKS